MGWQSEFTIDEYQQYAALDPEAWTQCMEDPDTATGVRALVALLAGQHWLAQNDVNRAIAGFEQVCDLRDHWPAGWLGRAAALLQAGDAVAALDDGDRALTLKPDTAAQEAAVWAVRGVALYRLQRYEAAVTSCEQAIATHPESALHPESTLDSAAHPPIAQTLRTLADALAHLGRYQEALGHYDRLVHIAPETIAGWGNRGMTLQKLGDYEGAIASYDKILDVEPDNYRLWHRRGLAARHLGCYTEAAANFTQSLAVRPDFYAATRSRLYLWAMTGQLLRGMVGGGTPEQQGQIWTDLQTTLYHGSRTQLPALVVVGLAALVSTGSRPMALAAGAVVLAIAGLAAIFAEGHR